MKRIAKIIIILAIVYMSISLKEVPAHCVGKTLCVWITP
jgi:hypothetical protein